MMPRVDSAHFEGMKLIRPMYCIREDDIKAWRDYNNLAFLQCACRFTESRAAAPDVVSSKRAQTKQLIRTLCREDDGIAQNIFKSAENVNLSTIIAYKDKEGVKHYFYDDD